MNIIIFCKTFRIHNDAKMKVCRACTRVGGAHVVIHAHPEAGDDITNTVTTDNTHTALLPIHLW